MANLSERILEAELHIKRATEVIATLEASHATLQERVEKMKADAVTRERNAMRTGLIFLGTMILSLIGVIWANLELIVGGQHGTGG